MIRSTTVRSRPDRPRALRVGGDEVRPLASIGESVAGYEIFEVTGPKESGPPRHTHPWNEAYYVLEGELEVTVAAGVRRLGPGSFLSLPARLVHAYRISSERARFLVITDPPGAGRFFEDLDGLTDLQAIVATALKHELTVHG